MYLTIFSKGLNSCKLYFFIMVKNYGKKGQSQIITIVVITVVIMVLAIGVFTFYTSFVGDTTDTIDRQKDSFTQTPFVVDYSSMNYERDSSGNKYYTGRVLRFDTNELQLDANRSYSVFISADSDRLDGSIDIRGYELNLSPVNGGGDLEFDISGSEKNYKGDYETIVYVMNSSIIDSYAIYSINRIYDPVLDLDKDFG